MKNEILSIKNLKQYNKLNNNYKIKKHKKKINVRELKDALLATMLIASVIDSIFFVGHMNEVEASKKKYGQEIVEHDDYIRKYASKIRFENLSDIEIIMKIMNDLRKNNSYIENSKKINIAGYNGLSLYMNHEGVCKSFAEEFVSIINEVDPKYNARCLKVLVDQNVKQPVPNVDSFKNVQLDSESEKSIEEKIYESNEEFFKKQWGDHTVALVDVKIDKKNITLVVDPPNAFIGYLKNGRIETLSSNEQGKLKYSFAGQMLYDPTVITTYDLKKIESFFNNIDKEKIEQEFGLEAQNKALENNEVKRKIK